MSRGPSSAARMVHKVIDLGGRYRHSTDAELAAVRQMLLRQPDAPVLLQMLGLAPYQSADLRFNQARHGSKTKYDGGCRCDPCAAYGRRKVSRQLERKANGSNNVTTHNRYGYHRGCRCDRCVEDNRTHERERSRRRRASVQLREAG